MNYSGAKETLNQCNLLFKNIHEYNDPFELIPATSSDLFRFTPDEIRKKMEDIVQTEEGKKKIQELETSLGMDDFIMGVSFIASAVYFPILTATLVTGLFLLDDSDEEERIRLFAKKYFPLFKSVKCCCFSESFDNNLMWSHYADKHCGIVLSFDPFVDYWKGDEFREVIYSDKRAGLPTEEGNANEYVWKMLTQKSKDWAYEQEWRMIKINMGNEQYLPFSPEALKGIRLGLNVKESQRDEIKSIRDRMYKNAVIYQAKFNRKAYKLDFETI